MARLHLEVSCRCVRRCLHILEPIHVIPYHVLWYTGGSVNGHLHGHQRTLLAALGLPQPVWVLPAYVMGLLPPWAHQIFRMAGVLVITTAVFETTAINIDLYGYYGQAPMRLLKYPLWIAVMEAAQVTGFTVLCAVLARRKAREAHTLALFALFPVNFGFDVLGAGFPTLIVMNTLHPNVPLLWVTSVVSIGFAATSLWWTGQLLIHDQQGDVVEPDALDHVPTRRVTVTA